MVINFITVLGVRGSKRPKNCVHTKSIWPQSVVFTYFSRLWASCLETYVATNSSTLTNWPKMQRFAIQCLISFIFGGEKRLQKIKNAQKYPCRMLPVDDCVGTHNRTFSWNVSFGTGHTISSAKVTAISIMVYSLPNPCFLPLVVHFFPYGH